MLAALFRLITIFLTVTALQGIGGLPAREQRALRAAPTSASAPFANQGTAEGVQAAGNWTLGRPASRHAMLPALLGCIAIAGVLLPALLVLGKQLRRDFSDGQSFWEEV